MQYSLQLKVIIIQLKKFDSTHRENFLCCIKQDRISLIWAHLSVFTKINRVFWELSKFGRIEKFASAHYAFNTEYYEC